MTEPEHVPAALGPKAQQPDWHSASEVQASGMLLVPAAEEEPEVPVLPVDPEEPVDPSEPVEPVEPVDPVELDPPVDPVEPVEPDELPAAAVALPRLAENEAAC